MALTGLEIKPAIGPVEWPLLIFFTNGSGPQWTVEPGHEKRGGGHLGRVAAAPLV